jgi:peptide/nickel transport system substrate-binding protein
MLNERRWVLVSALAGIVFLVACAPGSGRPSASQAPSAVETDHSPAPANPKRLTIALQNEPRALMTIMGGDAGGGPAAHVLLALHQHLAMYTDRGEPYAMLATELPSQANGTWLIRPDGTMQTIYRLRPSVTWHDGVSLASRDFGFAHAVMTDPELPIETRSVARLITRVETPDDRTLVVEWNQTYPFAHVLAEPDLGPLPAHLLESAYQADKERFQRLPYWGNEFVGVGPYRLLEWQLGSQLVLQAYDPFHGGRAKIDTLIFRFIPDESTTYANLMAGSVDGQFRSLDFNKVMAVKDEWERAGRRPLVLVQPTYYRMNQVQYRPEITKPRELTDVRVRRGLLHAMDRKAIVDAVYLGQALVAGTFIPPDDVKWDWVKSAVVPYPFDTGRAQQLLAEAGWRRGADGNVFNAAGERAVIPLWTTQGGQWESEAAITADHWRSIGLGVDEFVIPGAQSRDPARRATFPGISSTPITFAFSSLTEQFYGRACGTEATRWAGGNRGCYQNPAADEVISGLLRSVDRTEQQRLWRELVRIHGEDLPNLPTYFYVQGTVFREGVSGIKGENRPSISATWNVTEWDVR